MHSDWSKNLWFFVPGLTHRKLLLLTIMSKSLLLFYKTMDHIFYGVTCVINPHGRTLEKLTFGL